MSEPYVVVGGGIAGMTAAYLLKRALPDQEVLLSEREKDLGGLLRSFDYGDDGVFDYGTHTIVDTGVPELDRIIHHILPAEDWLVYSGVRKDLAGTFINGKLQTNSAYIDLRSFGENKLKLYTESFFENLEKAQAPPADFAPDEENAESYFRKRYGSKITEEVIGPVVEKVFSIPLAKADPFVSKILPLDRVVMLDEKAMAAMAQSAELRSRIAFPEQLNLPAHLVSSITTRYPKKYGIYRFVEAFEEKIQNLGVQVLKGASISAAETAAGKIKTLLCSHQNLETKLYPKHVLWTTGIPPAYFTLKAQANLLKAEPPLKTGLVNLVLKERPSVPELYYSYCFEKSYLSHRLNCPFNFCEESFRDGRYRLGVEVVGRDLEPKTVLSRVKEELTAMKLIRHEDVDFERFELLPGGYPSMDQKSLFNLRAMRDGIQNLGLRNLSLLGMMSKPNLFYQTDVLKGVYEEVRRIQTSEN